MRVILVRRCFLVGVMTALLFGVGNVQAQRGAKVPPEHANQEPINHLPNPYETVRDFGTLPDGRTWGSVSALNVDIDGVHIWVADRCGSNSCAESNVDPIGKMDPEGNVVKSFGAGLITWPHGMDVDSEGNVWIVDARSPNQRELDRTPNAPMKGHQVVKFSPDGDVLLVLGSPGERGDPPTHFTEPNDVAIGPDGSIYVGETHNGQFLDEPGPNAIGRISKFAPDGTFIKSWGQWGFRDGEFRAPHSLSFDSQGRLFVADRGTIVFKYSIRMATILIRGTSSVASVACSSMPMMCCTRSILNRMKTTILVGGVKACGSEVHGRVRSGTSSVSTSPSEPLGWAVLVRWVKG